MKTFERIHVVYGRKPLAELPRNHINARGCKHHFLMVMTEEENDVFAGTLPQERHVSGREGILPFA